MSIRALLAFTAGLAMLAGCATPTPDNAVEARTEPVYRTGSNLPVRDPAAATRTQTVRPDEQPMTRGMPMPRPGGGG